MMWSVWLKLPWKRLFVWGYFSVSSCVSTDSLVSQRRADIFIGPEITYGTGCWLLWGWTREQVDRRPVSADAFTGHMWPPVEHVTACDRVCWAQRDFFQRLSLGWITPPQTQHLGMLVVSFLINAPLRKYSNVMLSSSRVMMKKRFNNIYTTCTFLHESNDHLLAGWLYFKHSGRATGLFSN